MNIMEELGGKITQEENTSKRPNTDFLYSSIFIAPSDM